MQKSTKNSYIKIIKNFNFDSKKPLDILKNLTDNEQNNKYSLSYIKMIICAHKYHYNTLDNPSKDINDTYTQIINELNKLTKEQESSGINKFKKIKWTILLKHLNDDMKPIEKVITGLYLLLPPRRLNDYTYLTYVDKEDEINNKNLNYYIKSTNELYFQNYKTFKKFGIQKIKVPNELKNIIHSYITSNNIKSGESIIKMNKFNLAKKLKKIFGVSVDGLRHSYISWLYQDINQLFNIQKVSYMMGHDVSTHLKYLDKQNI